MEERVNVLVVGAAGQLGSELRRIASCGESGNTYYFADLCDGDFARLDILDRGALDGFVSQHKIGAIINCAAYTAVDRAEEDSDAAYAVNARGVENLALCARQHDCVLVHVSTDYVFDGSAREPYREDSAVNPQGVYGRSKLDGERAVADSGCRGVIIRTSWLYSCFGANFVKTMLRLGREKSEIRVVADQSGSPTYAGDLAQAIVAMLPKMLNDSSLRGEIYHYSNAGQTTWHGFATRIMEMAGLGCAVLPVSSAEYGSLAFRPAYSVMDTSKIVADFGVAVPAWESSLERCIKEIESDCVVKN